MARSLNRVQLIGNLTRDPELRYTPSGSAVCSFSLATNRSWTTDSGEKHEDAEYHRIVAWNKLAELCSQLLVKGSKVYIEGRLSTRSWTAQDGAQKSVTEIVADDMILLDSKRGREAEGAEPKEAPAAVAASRPARKETAKQTKSEEPSAEEQPETSEIAPDDIPF